MSNSPHSQVEAAQKLSSIIRMKFCSGRNLGKALNSTKKAISCLRLSREQINHSEVYVIYIYIFILESCKQIGKFVYSP